MNISFVTLGCKVNLCETQGLMQLALARGDQIVTKGAQAVVVNSCAVTAMSEHKNIRALHKARRDNPDAVIAVIGCMAQTNADRLLRDGTADLICGVQDRAAVLDACAAAIAQRGKDKVLPAFREIAPFFEPLPAGVPRGRTRALLKVEDGCNHFCSYCVIPYARGRVRSLSPEKALAEAARLAAEGVREIVVTGIEISSYGTDLSPRVSLIDLIEQLCRSCPEVRFRLGSLEPRTADQNFCDRIAALPNLVPHFHLSLQSGCDSVLKRMNRKYTCEMFRTVVGMLRGALCDCSITADVIVGFPGETEEEFQETCSFIREIGFSDVHVFPYSIRPGTKAAAMPDQLSEEVKRARADAVRALASELSESYRKRFIGRTLTILPEHQDRDGVWSAHSPYYFPVYVAETGLKKNRPVAVSVCGILRDGVEAKTYFEGQDTEKTQRP